ncbi:EAL domain-containing protein [Orientia tsutsugamushi]|nr:EAL domain-containing protein [Orientia tsutsugamushi]
MMRHNFCSTRPWLKVTNVFDDFINHGGGVVLLIKIQNYNNLLLIAANKRLKQIFQKFKLILSTICKVYVSKHYVFQWDYYFIIVFPKIDKSKVSTIAYDIYYKSQMVTFDKDKLFLKCKISSIKFPEYGTKLLLLIKYLKSYLDDSSFLGYYSEFNFLEFTTELKKEFKALALFKEAQMSEKLLFAYQPIVESRTGKILYYECLLRILDAANKLTSAEPFILLAEKNGFINVIDKMVLRFAIKELSSVPDLTLAINISNIGVLDSSLIAMADELLSSYPVADRLTIEITETAFNNDVIKTIEFIEAMHNKGCQVAIDDFGAGFFSFKHLQMLQVDIIKIGGCFIRDINDNYYNKSIVKTLVETAAERGIETVAEFVENGQIAKILMDINVNYMQGNFFAPAMHYKPWNSG